MNRDEELLNLEREIERARWNHELAKVSYLTRRLEHFTSKAHTNQDGEIKCQND